MNTRIFSELLVQTILSILVGAIVAVTAHYFIEGARYFLGWVTNFRQPELTFEARSISLTPILAMIVGAFLIIIVRKVLGQLELAKVLLLYQA